MWKKGSTTNLGTLDKNTLVHVYTRNTNMQSEKNKEKRETSRLAKHGDRGTRWAYDFE